MAAWRAAAGWATLPTQTAPRYWNCSLSLELLTVAGNCSLSLETAHCRWKLPGFSKPVKILSTADLHIGRSPTRVPDAIRTQSSCARMWLAIVELAIREEVDLVTLSGDVVDHANRFFEATGPLESGIARLAQAGIDTYAVSGNHDHDVLPRIVDAVATDRFHLLGRNGQWESADFVRNGKPQLRIWGWSFPDRHYDTNPLAGWTGGVNDQLPSVGLLHADLDVLDSRYAPVSRSELAARPLTAWLLGHVHTPQTHEMESGSTLLYPGSPQAMDPGETGVHGPWLIEIHSRSQSTARQISLSKVRYSELEIDLSGVETKDALDACLLEQTQHHLETIARTNTPPEFVSLRIELTGRTQLCGQIDDHVRSLDLLERSCESVTQKVEKVTNRTLPAIDLQQLAQQHDPPGVLARTLLELQAGRSNDSLQALLDEAYQKQRDVFQSSSYATLSGDTLPDLHTTRQRLLQQGTLLLDRLLAQGRSP
ncbi:MAG: DNA repair exonuclease [Planctomycetota bacterium]|nr:DNA repair exonuclease [Planctomycetota bacterium]